MVQRTINKSNWSGERRTYNYTKDTISVNGYKFKLKRSKKRGDEYIDVLSEEHSYKRVFGLFKLNGEWHSYDSYVEREGKSPYDVIATVVWNTF